MTTPRERREMRAAAERRKDLPMTIARRAIWPLVGVLVIGGVAAAVYFGNEAVADCPGHWHATVGVFIDDDRVPFPQPPYNMDQEGGKLPMAMHMHRGDQELLHFEPGTKRCIGVGDTMRMLDVDLESGRMTLGGTHAQGPYGGSYTDEGNRTVRIHIATPGVGLREVAMGDVLGYQLRDGEKMIATYGNQTADQIEAMMGQLNWPTGFDADGRVTR